MRQWRVLANFEHHQGTPFHRLWPSGRKKKVRKMYPAMRKIDVKSCYTTSSSSTCTTRPGLIFFSRSSQEMCPPCCTVRQRVVLECRGEVNHGKNKCTRQPTTVYTGGGAHVEDKIGLTHECIIAKCSLQFDVRNHQQLAGKGEKSRLSVF